MNNFCFSSIGLFSNDLQACMYLYLYHILLGNFFGVYYHHDHFNIHMYFVFFFIIMLVFVIERGGGSKGLI